MFHSSLKLGLRLLCVPLLSVYYLSQGVARSTSSGHDSGAADGLSQGVSESFNSRILRAIGNMPAGGGYSLGRDASRVLCQAVSADAGGRLNIAASTTTPSFCSGAVYLVLLGALKPEIDSIPSEKTRLDLIRALSVRGQADGVQMWGRWNSNGPCMAVAFAEAGLGRSFWDIKSAIPGDFLKIWWTTPIGRDEFGHSVIFLGFTAAEGGEEGVEIWSSNKPGGYGKKVVPLSKIKHALVSRCEHPENVSRILNLKQKNEFLGDMLKKNSSRDEVDSYLSLLMGSGSKGKTGG